MLPHPRIFDLHEMSLSVQEADSAEMVDSKALWHINEEIGEPELKQLEGFACNLAKKYAPSRGVRALPKGGTFKDLVYEAVRKTIYTGGDCYTWDQDQRPDIFDQLKYVIRDVLRGRCRRDENEQDAGRLDHWEIERRAEAYDGEAKMEAEMERNRRIEQLDTLREAIEERDDPVMLDVFDGILEGFSRSEIVEILGIDERDYDNAYKRIMRLGPKILEQPPSS